MGDAPAGDGGRGRGGFGRDARAPRRAGAARARARARRRRQGGVGPVTKLGRLVKEGKIKSLEEIFLYSMPIKEYQIPKKILAMAGLEDCYSTTRGHSRTTGNFITAVFNAIAASYGYLSPELWKPTVFSKNPSRSTRTSLQDAVVDAKEAAY
ncbi:hypothetical protein JL721_3900 [Aureococcus anophagefferens]|nr:hypothetical protein JL721_3900 [Aureococcus anophagefferens]